MTARKTPAGRPEEPAPSPGPSNGEGAPTGIRLNKLLAANGIASRRRADLMIEAGKVLVDGELVTELGLRVDPERQRVEVDGVVLRPAGERHRYYLLNKPSGVVCTNDVRESRPRAVDLITDKRTGRIYTVGRLDEDTVGIVILTNDGEFANKVGHPRYGVAKTYRVTVDGRANTELLRRLREGVRLSEYRARFADVRIVKRSEHRSQLLVTLQQGRNREIRRALAHLGLRVRALRRVGIGDLGDRGLKVGHWRPLTREEIAGLLDLASGKARRTGARSARGRGRGGQRGQAEGGSRGGGEAERRGSRPIRRGSARPGRRSR